MKIVAELSGNHDGQKERAIKIIYAAKEAGATSIKLQTYTADTLTLNVDNNIFRIEDTSSLWHGRHLYELYDAAHTPWEWHPDLYKCAKDIGIEIFSTPFDRKAVDFLESLDNPIYKISSFEIIDLPLIKYAAETRKPLIISTGIASLQEIAEAVETATASGCGDITLLHCISSYPAPLKDMNLMTIPALKREFGVKVGLSDHSKGTIAPMLATSLGAEVIEKHLKLDSSDQGVDAAFSLEPNEFRDMVNQCQIALQALGTGEFRSDSKDIENARTLARSLFVTQDVLEGDRITSKNIRSIRPGNGLPPKCFPTLLGKRFSKDIPLGTPLSWDAILVEDDKI